MVEVTATAVADVIGIMKTDDGQHVLLGFRDRGGVERRLALDKKAVAGMLECIFEATSIAPLPKGLVPKEHYLLKPDWSELWSLPGTNETLLTLFRGERHLSFLLLPGMVDQIYEAAGLILAAHSGSVVTDQSGKAKRAVGPLVDA